MNYLQSIDLQQYVSHIDFIYTTLLMVWGGSLIGVTMVTIPFIFRHIKSNDEASTLTSAILKRLDVLIRIVVLCMFVLFIVKKQLDYNYQYFEWFFYVCVLHLFIFGKITSKRLHKLKGKITTFDEPYDGSKDRKQFKLVHKITRAFYGGQILGVIVLLYLHAFGL
ncbi:MAG: hypothetical protein GY786_00360 [Proteobacteria bacterium]|nr:hypothetical protein [Pseudomonadota bacterium]